MPGPIKVLVVDDSLITVQTITRILQTDPSIKVVGHALDGERAIKAVETLQPDVVTMDINMPRMDGIEATKLIVRQQGTPIVVVSAYASANSVALQTIQALQSGAIESVQKPSGEIGLDLDLVAAELIAKVKGASRARPSVVPSKRPSTERASVTSRHEVVERRKSAPPGSWRRSMPGGGLSLVAIGVSTGGPSTLEQFLPLLHSDFPLPIALVIHMPEVFIPILAQNLDSRSRLEVKVAEDGMPLRPGQVVVAPGGSHLALTADLRADLRPSAPVNGCLPAADVLFDSIAKNVVRKTLGLVLTGMGRDGAKGLLAMREAGHVTAAQDEASSVIYGMPRAAAANGGAMYEVALRDMVRFLEHAAGRE